MSDVFLQCLYHEPEQHDEAALSDWIATWAPRIIEDEDATRNLMTQIFESSDPDFLPYLALLQACLEDANLSAQFGSARGTGFLKLVRTLVGQYRSQGDADVAVLGYIEQVFEAARVDLAI